MKSKRLLLLFLLGIFFIGFGILSKYRFNNSASSVLSLESVITPSLASSISPSEVLDTDQAKGIEDNPTPFLPISSQAEVFKVSRVVDGDTIQLENGQKLRYIGINTPETVDPRRKVQCFGKEASLKNKDLLEGKTIRLEKDISQTDKYGRLLRYVYLETSDGVELFINDYLVREGYAYATSYPPDIKYQNQFNTAQKEARQNNKGLWANCPTK